MSRITENELIIPSLKLLSESENKKLSTTELLSKLRVLLKPSGDDLLSLQGRKDDKFSQKVRNLRSHGTLEQGDITTYNSKFFTITEVGEKYLRENKILLNEIIPIDTYYDEFNESIDKIKELSEQTISPTLENSFFNMLYSSTITTLETYLFDTLKYNLNNEEEFLRNFVSSYDKYGNGKDIKILKFEYREIFEAYENILFKVNEDISYILFHKLSTIRNIYKGTFDIDFNDIDELIPCVLIRHDIVHRNGKTANDVLHVIKKDEVLVLCDIVSAFIDDIEEKINAKIESLKSTDSD